MSSKLVRKGRDSFSDDLLRHTDESGSSDSIVGAEYFTVKATGQGGMSQSGLARFVGKNQSTISRLIKQVQEADPMQNSLSEPLKPFAGQVLSLMQYTDPEGREVLEDGFCAAVIQHYACWSRDAKNNTQAKLALKLITHLGLRSLIHYKTGWESVSLNHQVLRLQEEVNFQRGLLEETVAEMEGAHSVSRIIHNSVHNQSGHLDRPLKKVKDYLKSVKSPNKNRREGGSS